MWDRKFLEGNLRVGLYDRGLGKAFPCATPNTQTTAIDKLDFIILKEYLLLFFFLQKQEPDAY